MYPSSSGAVCYDGAIRFACYMMIDFDAKLVKVGSWTVVVLPPSASTQLPSRGQAMVQGTFNGVDLQTPLEPDGTGTHWFRPDGKLLKATSAKLGDTVSISIEPVKAWPEPEVPADWQKALAADKQARALWERVTPMARWEWIRWARATSNAETRQRRIEVGCSKLRNGERRPCCWNRNLCTEPTVSKNGVLLKPSSV